ncbi:unnamed protein product [Cuscuta campestris]|uniref:Ty3 transposon capsid-like protein domain-containing protein n=1 Tax=Cuscuta campestris TaxID=132261 RepID=A0A484LC90_9ASTE|nr:unnamed protein product [Cuscuta campestris]
MAPSDQPHSSLTLEDVMHALEALGNDLQDTKSRVADLVMSRRPAFSEHQRPVYQTNPGWRPPASRTTPPTLDSAPRMRVDAPPFSGEDPTGWIFRVQKYFDYFLTPEPERWHLVAMLIDHPASEWFHYYQANNPMATWPEFLDAVQQRFDPTYYENYVGLLSKLTQTSTVLAYQTEFESLLNKVSGVPESTLVAMFIAGLKQPIQREVNLRNPSTLPITFSLARELSACHSDATGLYGKDTRRPWSSRPPVSPTAGILPTPPSSSRATPPPPAGRGSDSNSKLPIVWLTNTEKTERTKKGLCWYCDEKWVPGHNCKHRFLLLMGPDHDDDSLDDGSGIPPDDDLITADISSLNSLAGNPSPRALKLAGTVHGSLVQVLLDSGSTHNFIHPGVAERLHLPLQPIPPFRVYVGNGDSLRCSHSCPQTSLSLQGNVFLVDLYILEIHGTDVVLGVQWLQTLGRICHDYAKMTMEFTMGKKMITLRGDVPQPRAISYGHLCTLLASPGDWAIFELLPARVEQQPVGGEAVSLPEDTPPTLRPILLEFASVFGAPAALPPSRSWDHRIHLGRDGQTEVLNRSLEQYLRAFTHERPSKWVGCLPWAKLALNCSYHEGLGTSPFRALYGREPPSVFPTISVRAKNPEVEEVLRERADLLDDLKTHLRKMQHPKGNVTKRVFAKPPPHPTRSSLSPSSDLRCDELHLHDSNLRELVGGEEEQQPYAELHETNAKQRNKRLTDAGCEKDSENDFSTISFLLQSYSFFVYQSMPKPNVILIFLL